jgi:hypothetical protein
MQQSHTNGANARGASTRLPSSGRTAARAAALRAIAHQPHQRNPLLPDSSDRCSAAPAARAPHAHRPQTLQSATEIAARAVSTALAAPEHLREQVWQQQQAQAMQAWRQQQRAASIRGAERSSSGNSARNSENGDPGVVTVGVTVDITGTCTFSSALFPTLRSTGLVWPTDRRVYV